MIIENLTEDTDPTIHLGDTVRTALTDGDSDTVNWLGANAGTIYTVSVTGLDPDATYTLVIANANHSATLDSDGTPYSNSMSLTAATIIDGEMHVAFSAGWSIDFTITLAQVGGDGTTLADISVIEGNDLTLGEGHDLFRALATDESVIDGGAGNDTLNGSSSTEVLLGGDGDDRLTATGSGNVVIHGGLGDDVLHGAGDSDLLLGGAGNDSIT